MTPSAMTVAVILIYLVVSTNCKSIGDSANNVTKRDANPDPDLFPDWVPFKNKHGDQLGDFIPVEPKKPKKRLALPVNFVLRAVADTEPDDYYEKGQGDADNEDYYEQKDWSDTNRREEPATFSPNNHIAISDIDGVVGIITRHQPDVLKDSDKKVETPPENSNKIRFFQVDDKKIEKDEQNDAKEEQKEEKEVEKEQQRVEKEQQKEEDNTENKDKKAASEEEYSDYEEEKTEKQKATEEEQREAEARKAAILESVNQLKARHESEQRAISEKLKEEAMQKEEFERDTENFGENDKYGNKRSNLPAFDEYDDKSTSTEDKYLIKMSPEKIKKVNKVKKDKQQEQYKDTGRFSVFRNPDAYMVYDEEPTSVTPSTVLAKSTPRRSQTRRFSARYSTPSRDSNDSERISFVPHDGKLKDGEPTLFFPRKRKNARRGNKILPRKPEPDSFTAETHQDDAKKPILEKVPVDFNQTLGSSPAETDTSSIEFTSTAASDETVGPSLTGSLIVGPTRAVVSEDTKPSTDIEKQVLTATGSDTSGKDSSASAAEATDVATADAEPAPSEHADHDKGGDSEFETGGQKDHHSQHHASHGSSDKKAYEGEHKSTKTDKGHHDKEDHLGSYHDHGGHDDRHHDEKKHYGHHHHEEQGKKHAEYEESGKHSKGHSTKGSHDVHKKDEYEKKVEFFEEEGDSVEEEKHGGHAEEKKHHSGGGFKQGNHDSGFEGRLKGDTGHFNGGAHLTQHKGHKAAAGHDSHGKHGFEKQNKGFHENGKKWIYHHGYPAKDANLVVIDRRVDQLYHGPQYYG